MNEVLLIFFGSIVALPAHGQFRSEHDAAHGAQSAFYECSVPLPLDPGKFNARPGQLYFQFDTASHPKGLKALKFTWLPDEPTGYFTAFLINTTDSILNARQQDGSLIMIQEALNTKGEWAPIEYWTYSGCGNSYFSRLVLPPGQCALLPIRQYSGPFLTKLRLKWKNGTRTLYSDSFEGSIEPGQFNRLTAPVEGILYHGPASFLED
jgi:hypothetical protein